MELSNGLQSPERGFSVAPLVEDKHAHYVLQLQSPERGFSVAPVYRLITSELDPIVAVP